MRRPRFIPAAQPARATAAACLGAAATAVTLGAVQVATATTTLAAPPNTVGSYIVVLKSPSTASTAAEAFIRARSHGVEFDKEFKHAIKGYTAHLDSSQLAAVRSDPDVAYVEPDQIVHAKDDPAPSNEGDQPVQADLRQPADSWGLDRIDQRNPPPDGIYNYRSTGAGVTAYIVDTGLRASHQDFGRRTGNGFSAIDDGNGTDDCNGHGTHVAGTIGGTSKGVAKRVQLVGVRVLDCEGSGTVSGVIAGIDWVTANAAPPSVVNLSLGGSPSRALDQAVRESINSGLTYTLSAGNEDDDACNYSPGRVADAITVGATTIDDERDTRYSNYGSCLDVFAPGTDITSDWNSSDTATASLSGTSMAAPHVAGVAALYLQRHPHARPEKVRDALVDAGTRNVLDEIGDDSPDVLLYSRGRGF